MLGPYRVERKLGAGGMGVVYLARDTRLARAVALKVLPAAVAADSERRARFMREARSAAAVNHSNIAAVYDVGETDGRIYIAIELVEGTTLRARLAAGPLPAPEALRIARAIATGVARAHEKGIVHRDLKPENVMLAADGAVTVTSSPRT
jgi:serine/threonine protein kinase